MRTSLLNKKTLLDETTVRHVTIEAYFDLLQQDYIHFQLLQQ